MEILRLARIDSTNSYAAREARNMPDQVIITADSQTAGRGQRGNSWEAEPGLNLTFSLFFRPSGFPAREQFFLSEAVALAVRDALEAIGVEAKVKWPNDIYVGSRKIAGLLLEHKLIGPSIAHTIAGIGLNVNQRRFLSDAPNPVSVWQLTGRETDLSALLNTLADCLETRLSRAFDEKARPRLHADYMAALWRGTGIFSYRDVASGEVFSASVEGVEPLGHILLRSGASLRRYAFKEVEFLL